MARLPFPILLSLACLLALVSTSCQPGSATAQAEANHPDPPRSVQAIQIHSAPVERWISALGALAAEDQATLSAKVAGRLDSIAVDIGSQVRSGQKLAQIEKRDYELKLQQAAALLAQARAKLGVPPDAIAKKIDPEQTSTVRQARALFDEAKANYDRVSKLFDQGIISKADVESAAAAFQVALNRYQDAREEVTSRQALLEQRQAELEIARQDLADTTLSAPFDGTVQDRKASPGEFLVQGTAVLTLVRMDPLRLHLEVSERDAPSIRVGQIVQMTLPGDTAVYSGKLSRISPALNENRMLVVEADISNPGTLHPGTFVQANIVVSSGAPALLIPARSLITFAGLEKVFVAANGFAKAKDIVTGVRRNDWIEVLSGLAPGEWVILEPGNLRSDQPVICRSTPLSPDAKAR